MYSLNYSGPTALANRLHSLKHVDWSWNTVATDPQSVVAHPTPYVESLTVLIALPAMAVLLYALCDTIVMCCRGCNGCGCCKRCTTMCGCARKSNMADNRYRIRLGCGIGSSIAALITIILAFTYAKSFEGHVNDVISDVSDADSYRMELIDSITDAQGQVRSEAALLNAVVSNLTAAESAGVPPDLLAQLEEAADQVATAESSMADVLSRFTNHFELQSGIDRMHQVNDLQMNTSAMVFVFFLFSLSLLVLLSVLAESPNCCRNTLEALALLAFTVTLLSACVHLGISTGVADVCQQPNEFSMAIATNQLSNPDDVTMIGYYLYCNPDSSNPQSGAVLKAYDHLNSSTTPLIRLITYLEQNSSQSGGGGDPALVGAVLRDARYLQSNVSYTLTFINSTATEELDCPRLHTDIVSSFETMCGPALTAFYSVLTVQIMAAIFLMLARWCLPVRYTDVLRRTRLMYEEFAAPTDVIVTESADGSAAPTPTSLRFVRYAPVNNHSVGSVLTQPNSSFHLAPTQDSPPTLLAKHKAQQNASASAQSAAIADSNAPALEPPLLHGFGSLEHADSPVGSTAKLPAYGQPLLNPSAHGMDD